MYMHVCVWEGSGMMCDDVLMVGVEDVSATTKDEQAIMRGRFDVCFKNFSPRLIVEFPLEIDSANGKNGIDLLAEITRLNVIF